MKRNRWGLIAGALLGLAACGPMDDGGGGVVGDPCTQPSECVANGCCGNGNGAVGIANAPSCPGTCPPGSPDPTNMTVNNTCGIPTCSSFHCTVATRC